MAADRDAALPAGLSEQLWKSTPDNPLIEISDHREHALDFISLPHDALVPHPEPSHQIAS